MALEHVEVGQEAPDFTLTSHTGEQVTLSSLRGKKVVLFFVRTPTCWQCREHVDQLVRQYEQFQAKNTEVLVILNADGLAAKQYANERQAPFPVLADPGHQIYEKYGLNKILLLNTRTGSVLVDEEGKIGYIRTAINPGNWLKESQVMLIKVDEIKMAG